MGWKTINGRQYYYRSRREGGRVVTEYVGGGRDAELIAALETVDRDKREGQRYEDRFDRERIEAEDRDFVEWFDRVEAVAVDALEAAGYHRHNRGEWRKRRGRTSDARESAATERAGHLGDHPPV
jgi:hypothetical protein